MSENQSTKHLEMLQASITRMAGYSFVAKGWSVTLTTAVLGLAAKDGSGVYLLVGALAIVLFWLIDAYYLSLERGFRTLFKAAVARREADLSETFDMAPASGLAARVEAAFRPAVLMVHLTLLAAIGIAGLLLDRVSPG